MIGHPAWCWDWSKNMHNRDWISAYLTHFQGHALQLAVDDIIKAIKILRGFPDAAFKLNKLAKYSVIFKSQKYGQILSEKERNFQQVEERHCTRKLWWQNIMPTLLESQTGIVSKHFEWLGCLSRAMG